MKFNQLNIPDEEREIKIIEPDYFSLSNYAPVVVRNEETRELFNKFIDTIIDSFIHNQIGNASGFVVLGLCSVRFNIYRIKKYYTK